MSSPGEKGPGSGLAWTCARASSQHSIWAGGSARLSDRCARHLTTVSSLFFPFRAAPTASERSQAGGGGAAAAPPDPEPAERGQGPTALSHTRVRFLTCRATARAPAVSVRACLRVPDSRRRAVGLLASLCLRSGVYTDLWLVVHIRKKLSVEVCEWYVLDVSLLPNRYFANFSLFFCTFCVWTLPALRSQRFFPVFLSDVYGFGFDMEGCGPSCGRGLWCLARCASVPLGLPFRDLLTSVPNERHFSRTHFPRVHHPLGSSAPFHPACALPGWPGLRRDLGPGTGVSDSVLCSVLLSQPRPRVSCIKSGVGSLVSTEKKSGV